MTFTTKQAELDSKSRFWYFTIHLFLWSRVCYCEVLCKYFKN